MTTSQGHDPVGTGHVHRVLDAAVDDLLRLSPELATELGEHAYDDRLDDLGDQALAAQAVVLRARRDELGGLDLTGLPPDDVVDAALLATGLDRRLFALDRLREHTWNPLVHLPADALHPLLVRDTLPVADRLRSLAARMSQVPDRLEQARATLAGVPDVHARTAASQCAGAAHLVRDEVGRLLGQEPSLRPLVEPAQRAAAEAIERYGAWLAALPGDGEPRLGPELFEAKLRLTLDAELPVDGVVAAAGEHLAAVAEQLERVARDWVGAYDDPVGEALGRVGAQAPDDATIVGLARRELEQTAAAVRRLGIVTVPDDPCEVEVMPEHRRGLSVAYCDAPGALERGGSTQFAISPTPAEWTAERVASFYREYNTAMVANLTVHEAMPGHVLQLAHARQHRGATRVRQVFASGSFIEGWAVHAERLMAEAGYGGVPVRLQQLKMQLRMTINALLDAGVHAQGMTEAQAMALMTGTGRQEEGEAVGKWRRALLSSGQLSTYFVGYLELAPLLAGRSSYDEVLAHGSPPPRHLRTLLATGRSA